uniref:Putative secreted protein n=1 Tax=Ixodes ricinus TaxID=34613 RepID=A0A6B0U1L6_IXORI
MALSPIFVCMVNTFAVVGAFDAAAEDLALLPPVELVYTAGSMDAVEVDAEDAIAVPSTRLLRMRTPSPT